MGQVLQTGAKNGSGGGLFSVDPNDKDSAEFEGFKWSLKAFKKWVVLNHGEVSHCDDEEEEFDKILSPQSD